MKRFATSLTGGLIAGSLLGAIGMTAILSDRNSRKRAMKCSRKIADGAADMLDDVKEKIW